jgi:hypothetical protein
MQAELLATDPGSRVRLFGVNDFGHETGNDFATSGRDLPLLQDAAQREAWGRWQPVYRDVVVLDAEGRRVAVYNLTANDLSVPERYAELLEVLRDVAGE